MYSDRILLEGMNFFGFHGSLAAEQELGQRFVVDISMTCDLRPAGLSDNLTETVDYSAVYEQARQIVEGPPVKLIEHVAERIAAAVLDEHPRVSEVQVKVAKPQVRLGNTVLAGSAVVIVRSRAA